MSERIRVMLAVPDLQDLGVQHDILCLLKFWDREAFEPVLLVHRREGEFASQFGAEIRSIEVDALMPAPPKGRVLLRPFGYARAFRAFRPHAVIPFVPYANLATLYGRRFSRLKFGVAVSEHAHVTASMRDTEAFSAPFLWYYRRRFTRLYNDRADLVKCIAEESRQDLILNHGIRAEKTRLIHNPVDFDEVRRLAREPVDHPWLEPAEVQRTPVFVNVGRLAAQKRQDVLLRAFAKVLPSRAARLILVGRGAHEERLKALAGELGVLERVSFVGFQRNPWKFMGRCSALVLSSEWEGLPCVLTEAMCLRLPIVSTRCPSGPTEMLLEGRAGLLCEVGDVEGLAGAMQNVLADAGAARQRAELGDAHLDRFEPKGVTRRYEALARELAAMAS